MPRGEADRGKDRGDRADVGGEDHDGAAEIDGAPGAIGEAAGIEELQTEVKDVDVRLLYFIEKNHGEGLLAHGVGQDAGFAIDSKQALEGLGAGVFAHVEAQEAFGITEDEFGHRAGQLRLAHSGGTNKEKNAKGLVRVGQAGLDEGDEVEHGTDCFGLAHDAGFKEFAHRALV